MDFVVGKYGVSVKTRSSYELDRLFIRLYEDNVSGKISDERFTMMSRRYEDEQCRLKAEAEVLRQEIETQEQQNQNLDSFIQKIRKYTELTELTPYAAHETDQGDLCRSSG